MYLSETNSKAFPTHSKHRLIREAQLIHYLTLAADAIIHQMNEGAVLIPDENRKGEYTPFNGAPTPKPITINADLYAVIVERKARRRNRNG